MDSGMIGKVEKAMLYAQEPERVAFESFTAIFKGDHKTHTVVYQNQHWHCDCDFFQNRDVCSHVMAMERLLMGSVKPAQASSGEYNSSMIAKVEKGMLYSHEPERLHFQTFTVSFKGDHETHTLTYNTDTWRCDCGFFHNRGICSHVMTLERLLTDSVAPAQAMTAYA